MTREKIEFDVVFVGGGPASLAGAIRLMQLAKEKQITIEVAVIEKGSEIGAHAISGAVLNPIALKELIPDYIQKGCPIEDTIRNDGLFYLSSHRQYKIPYIPKYLHNKGFHIISLSRFTRWLGSIAEENGVNIFPGFTGKKVLFDSTGKTIIGIQTGDKGLNKDGSPKSNFEPGIDLISKITIFGEGARGSLTKEIASKLDIFDDCMPQIFETGIKEVIQLPETNAFESLNLQAIHTLGFPLNFLTTPGGGFIYQMKDHMISLGFLVGLSYEDPSLDIYDTFMRYKRHPFIANLIKGGKVIEQGARTVSTGGFYTIPKLAFDGGMMIGGCAGIHHVPGLKGIHTAMMSGMLAAETCINALQSNDYSKSSLDGYSSAFHRSWLYKEIYEGRNFAAALTKKGPIKLVYLGAQYVTNGKGVRDHMTIREDYRTMIPATDLKQDKQHSDQHRPDGVLYVDKLTGVYLSKTMHREDQPCHIIVRDPSICMNECYRLYKNPCVRFCPGQVYEIDNNETTSERKLKLNPANCLHCKTCDIKDPFQNITWTCPEGGDGPGYSQV